MDSLTTIQELQKQKAMESKLRSAVRRKDVFQLVIKNEASIEALKNTLKGAGAFSVIVHDHSKKAKATKKEEN